MRKIGIVRACIGMCTIALVVGCASQTQPVVDQTEQTVRIAVFFDRDRHAYERQMYTQLFEATHPNTKVEIVSAVAMDEWNVDKDTAMHRMKKVLHDSFLPPDVVIMDTLDDLRVLKEENLLLPLDDLLKNDKVDLAAFVPHLLDGLKAATGGGQLFALAPLFSQTALFYNKKIFQDAGIEPPRDGMTWDEVLLLAEKIASGSEKDRIYGISLDGWWPSWVVKNARTYGRQRKLRFFDEDLQRMQINRPEWEQVFTTIISLHKQKVVPVSTEEEESYTVNDDTIPLPPGHWNWYGDNRFMQGKLAMMVRDSTFVSSINHHHDYISQFRIKESPIDWDVVTIPTFPEQPNVGGLLSVRGLMGIPHQAPNPDGAWDFIRFVHSADWARVKSRNQSWLSSLTKFIQPDGTYDYNIGAFYALPPDSGADFQKPNYFVDLIGELLMKDVMNGTLTLPDALKKWEEEGNEALMDERVKKKNSEQSKQ
jgi:multiple sugar transport system substrate-binding protein